MYNHATEEYLCPICIAIDGKENDDTWIVQDDIFYRDELVTGFISSKKIIGNDEHPLIVPNTHIENVYDLPNEIGHRIIEVAKQTAIALKELRGSDGTTIAQFNEPDGGQHAFHYHMHVVPRYKNDNFNVEFWKAKRSSPDDRRGPAQALKEWFEKH